MHGHEPNGPVDGVRCSMVDKGRIVPTDRRPGRNLEEP
jgi:hypothetical protein